VKEYIKTLDDFIARINTPISSGIFYPAASGDDGYWWPAGSLNTANMYVFASHSIDTMVSFIRFPNVNIPQGAVITEAFLRATADAARSGEAVCNIYANDADNATAPINESQMAALVYTTAYVEWDQGASWSASTQYDTPDISTVIQEIVDRGGWQSGNAMMLLLDVIGTTYNIISSYDRGTGLPELHIKWGYYSGN